MNTADKQPSRVHKSLRIGADLAERVTALKRDGESDSAAYSRVLEAGASALEACGVGDAASRVQGDTDTSELIAELRAHLETAKEANAALLEQIGTKDEQIRALSVIAAQAQESATKALEAGADDKEPKRRGLWSRFFGGEEDGD